ncbi:MAG: hypothetical protein IIB89_02230 [Chloroflexi bacterium]|nr:hypothetical protein [Chloroflexota bacterium]
MPQQNGPTTGRPTRLDPATVYDPYPRYEQLRSEDPVHWNEGIQAWVLTGYQDVLDALRDPRLSAERISALMRLAGSGEGLEALEQLLPEHYWIAKVRAAARDASDAGALLAQVYVERAYKLADEDFAAVQLLEKRIADLTAQGPSPDAPPSQDLRG